MSKKYIIEIEDEPFVRKSCLHGEDAVYRAVGFKSLVFDETGLEKLKPYIDGYDFDEVYDDAYNNGLNDAWEAARKIFCMDIDQYQKCFDQTGITNIMDISTALEAIAKLKEYEEKQEEINVGDEVIYEGVHAILLDKDTDTEDVWVLTENGCVEVNSLKCIKKAGRYFPEIAQVLEKMKGK